MSRTRKILKRLGIAFAALLVLAGAFAAHTWYFKPVHINLLFGRAFLKMALESPELLTSIRILEPLGIHGHNAKLDDESIAAGDRFFELILHEREVLRSYEDEDLAPGDRLSKRIAMGYLDLLVENKEFRFHNYPVNQLFGVQNGFISFMQSTHQVHNRRDAEHYVSRLNRAGVKFDQVLEGLRHRESLGILPPQFVVTKVLEGMREFIARPAEENVLVTSLVERMAKAGIEARDQERLALAARDAVEQTVYPAYARLIDYFAGLDNKVEKNFGVWNLPDGDRLYRQAIRLFTTTDETPEELHRLGLAEVSRLQGEITGILEAEGWDTSGGFTDAIARMKNDERFYYSDSAEGREQTLADYRAMIEEISAGLDQWFDVFPETAVEVRPVPDYREKTAPGAYYQRPSMDGSRPGAFYANLYDIRNTPRYGMRTLAFHEAVPGHHFQFAIMQQQDHIPMFRRMLPATAYTEGWGLYAEYLAWEMGFQQDPYDNIGRLQGELLRAVRLVVDTGIHAQRWSREQAIAYMVSEAGWPETEAVAEVERYFVAPGQALAYKVGMMKILELRKRAERELGDAFDIRAFHRVVLTNGALPLNILEELVLEWIEASAAEQT